MENGYDTNINPNHSDENNYDLSQHESNEKNQYEIASQTSPIDEVNTGIKSQKEIRANREETTRYLCITFNHKYRLLINVSQI